jgi:hypothetical protein
LAIDQLVGVDLRLLASACRATLYSPNAEALYRSYARSGLRSIAKRASTQCTKTIDALRVGCVEAAVKDH